MPNPKTSVSAEWRVALHAPPCVKLETNQYNENRIEDNVDKHPRPIRLPTLAHHGFDEDRGQYVHPLGLAQTIDDFVVAACPFVDAKYEQRY